MKRSRKQAARELLTADQRRAREVSKQMAADKALFVLLGGEQAWQAECNRRRAERNARIRAHTAAVVASKKAATDAAAPLGLWDVA